MTKFELALTTLVPALQVGLLVLLILRNAFGKFQAFFFYTAFAVLSGAAELAVHNSESIYFRVYWTSEAIYTILKFLALQEIFRLVFSSFYTIKWFRALFPGIGTLLIIVAILRNIFQSSKEADFATATILFAEVAVGILQVGIFGLFWVLVKFFRVRWRQHAFGIALGFGLSAAGSLVVYLLRSEFGTKFDPVLRITPPIAYTLGVVVWLVTFLIPQQVVVQPGVVSGLTPEQMLADIRRYSSIAKRIFKN